MRREVQTSEGASISVLSASRINEGHAKDGTLLLRSDFRGAAESHVVEREHSRSPSFKSQKSYYNIFALSPFHGRFLGRAGQPEAQTPQQGS